MSIPKIAEQLNPTQGAFLVILIGASVFIACLLIRWLYFVTLYDRWMWPWNQAVTG